MTTPTATKRTTTPRPESPPRHDVERGPGGEVLAAPLVALLAGIAAEWLDFRALRVPLLLMVGVGVLATAYRLVGPRSGWRPFALVVLVGVATWAGAESVYAVIHLARGERFHAGVFGPQWSQFVGLVAAHGLFLGAPTGAAAALILQAMTARSAWIRRHTAIASPLSAFRRKVERGPGGEVP
ncbi:MAG TPA: hypothetical protein VEZ14_08960 [Dehalococcoidia bacterium]|nr:hypothetical protein [Dehalococcoidia bacterium]